MTSQNEGFNFIKNGPSHPRLCPECDDGEGGSIYPHYGLAPHTHGVNNGIVSSTKIEPRSSWPSNFKEDPESEACGTYTHCLACGAPNAKGGA